MSTASERARQPSIRDVARLAGVSHQTVSRVLNDHPSIRPETKAKVLKGNYERIFDQGRASVRAWERAHAAQR